MSKTQNKRTRPASNGEPTVRQKTRRKTHVPAVGQPPSVSVFCGDRTAPAAADPWEAYAKHFPGCQLEAPREEASSSDQLTTASLLKMLFRQAKKDFGLKEDRLSDKQSCYAPLPLMGRLLQIVGEFCRDYLTITLQFSGREMTSGSRLLADGTRLPRPVIRIRIPDGLPMRGTEEEQELVGIIARAVLVTAQNEAMSHGFTACDIAVTGPPSPVQQTESAHYGGGANRLGASGWLLLLKETYESQHFGVLTDRYLRDYNTRRLTVAFSDTIREPKLKAISPGEIAIALQKCLDSQPLPNDMQASRRGLLLGIDIGATLTKIQFLKVEGGKILPVSDVVRFETPNPQDERKKKKSEQTANDKPPSANDDARLFAQEVCRRLDEFAYAHPEILKEDARLLAAGTTWPGPVHSGHVAGTSSLLRRFGNFQGKIVANKVEEILEFDIAEALKSHLRIKRAIPNDPHFEVALVNDGDADGYATLYREFSKDKAAESQNRSASATTDQETPTVAILKLGSGTATAVFSEKILPGLCEGGKFIVDLAAPLQHEDYPPGVANLAMSKKFLPLFAARLASSTAHQASTANQSNDRERPFDVSRLDSQELDMFLSADVRGGRLRTLVEELGLRDLADEETDVEVYRSVHTAHKEGKSAEPWLKRHVERKLNVAGDKVFDELDERVIARGLTRLAGVLGCDTQYVHDLLKERSTKLAQEALKKINTLIDKVIEPSASALGRYLGDYLVLYHDLYHWDRVYVEGGVLSGNSNERVRSAAKRRAAQLGLALLQEGKYAFRVMPPGDAGDTDDFSAKEFTSDSHSGCLGAAIFAAGQFIRQRKQRGLQALRQAVLNMPTNSHAKLTESEIAIPQSDTITLAQYGLSYTEVCSFLNDEAEELRIDNMKAVADSDVTGLQFMRVS